VRQSPIPLLIFIASLIGLGGAYVYFQSTQTGRYEASRDVLTERSEIRLRMLVRYDTGPLASEEYAMSDIEGTSGASYRLASRAGLQISITERPRVTLEPGMNVAFFFGEVVNDGIWELTSKPPRGDTSTHYEIEIAQISGRGHGSRRIVFTDPHYWATTGGHQYHIVLDKKKSVPDLLQMSSTTLVEPRYLKLVADFRAFGPPSLQAKIAAARARAGVRG
jgi:aromatic ring-cleaving dioxygenase